MTTIVSQPIATTNPDSRGERLPIDVLEEFAAVINGRGMLPVHKDHDLNRPPVGRMTNARVSRKQGTEEIWELLVDIELEEDAEGTFGGFSISVTREITPATGDTLIDLCLPYPEYQDSDCIETLSAIGSQVCTKAWIKRSAFPENFALLVSLALFLAAPAYTDLWKTTIAPALWAVLKKIKGGADFVQTVEGRKGEAVGVWLTPIRGREDECYELNRVVDALERAQAHLSTDTLADNRGVYMIKMSFSEDSKRFELQRVEYLDGSVVNHAL